jgi:hypothetical protein
LIETKLFAAAHLLCSLGIGAIVYLIVFKKTELLKATALICVLAIPLALPIVLHNKSGAELAATFAPWPYGSLMIAALGLKNWPSSPFVFALITLPIYLIGCLGLRVIGIPVIIRTLFRPDRTASLRFVLATFVTLGAVITLTCRVVPVGYGRPYNNSVWFLAQSKYVAWIFAVEVLQAGYRAMITRGLQPVLASSGLMLVTAFLTLPSTIQHFALERHPYQIYGKAVMTEASSYNVQTLEAITFLGHNTQPGDVVLASERLLAPVLAFTRCHVPIGYFAKYLVPQKHFLQRETAEKEFWKAWRRGQVQDDLLREAKVRYLAVDKKSGPIPEILPASLRQAFSNSECAIFRVQEDF